MFLALAGKTGRQSTTAFRGFLFSENTMKRMLLNIPFHA